MDTEPIDPQSIRNATVLGEPDGTAAVVRRLGRRLAGTGSGTWELNGFEHTVRLAELSSRAPLAELERAIRVADGVVAVLDAAVPRAPRLEAMLRVADDHQVARLCLVTGVDRPAADFPGCVRAIADIRGAVPLTVQLPLGRGAGFEGVLDLVSMWAADAMAAEFHGSRREFAQQQYRRLTAAVVEQDAAESGIPGLRRIPPAQLHDRIRRLTRVGDAVPVLCDAGRSDEDVAPLLDAIVRYLPSPLDVCQPEHALDW
ncbi:GTP-binding protein [Nocardia sp. alder85J]|uniref:GTP-binding protein n=1 Tax=Nocardia sp. alder85J TaxID=2862949 RepID=UPI001CD1F99F|nr:GTP-binding protein [Nocardia sp. alder85J]MCX4090933.1 GTP-binding protein [Nocardia sp. alder85J]